MSARHKSRKGRHADDLPPSLDMRTRLKVESAETRLKQRAKLERINAEFIEALKQEMERGK